MMKMIQMTMTLTLTKEMIEESLDQGKRSRHERLEECRKRFSLRRSQPTVSVQVPEKDAEPKETKEQQQELYFNKLLDPHSRDPRRQ